MRRLCKFSYYFLFSIIRSFDNNYQNNLQPIGPFKKFHIILNPKPTLRILTSVEPITKDYCTMYTALNPMLRNFRSNATALASAFSCSFC